MNSFLYYAIFSIDKVLQIEYGIGVVTVYHCFTITRSVESSAARPFYGESSAFPKGKEVSV